MAVDRMNREQFFRAMSGHDDPQLRKALWNLYWRGTADVRRRIEAELAGDIRPARKPEPPDPQEIRAEVAEFVALARSGAYFAGDRRVSPKERTRWRFTFKRLVTAAQQALHAEDPTPAARRLAHTPGSAAPWPSSTGCCGTNSARTEHPHRIIVEGATIMKSVTVSAFCSPLRGGRAGRARATSASGLPRPSPAGR